MALPLATARKPKIAACGAPRGARRPSLAPGGPTLLARTLRASIGAPPPRVFARGHWQTSEDNLPREKDDACAATHIRSSPRKRGPGQRSKKPGFPIARE